MRERSNVPTVRNLDGVYYRVIRDGKCVNRCFSDLSEDEQDVIMKSMTQSNSGGFADASASACAKSEIR